MTTIEEAHGLEEGESWPPGETPKEHQELRHAYHAAFADIFAEKLEEFGEHDMARLFRDDPDGFHDRGEAGRRFFHCRPEQEGTDAPEWMLRDGAQSPEEAFTYAWACQLLEDVIHAVAEQCRRDGKQTHWEIFRRKVVEPMLQGAQAPSIEQLCQEFHIAGPQRASNMLVTVKRRFQETLRRSVRRLVGSDQDVEEEIQGLMGILRGWRAR